ncbi:hypothetical protein HMPREF1580_00187 [Gardnerella vaginalis JCP8070]|nr:hypothetical protein HMPREF1586_00537 [Gardnerella vaginalis JCP8522]EPI47435.1 hypothetical protein HMPREF1583_00452 [Gardnerella vaginalis JCP8151B]EPI60799.1 hypothetical protein HMPREF1580_00187 [Gardnerella vaginalis JCP8070]
MCAAQWALVNPWYLATRFISATACVSLRISTRAILLTPFCKAYVCAKK